MNFLQRLVGTCATERDTVINIVAKEIRVEPR